MSTEPITESLMVRLFQDAAALHVKGDLAGAEAGYRELLRQTGHSSAYNNLGVLLMERGELAEGELCLRRALILDPKYADALHNLGNILREQNRLPEAVEAYREALRLKPDFADAQYNAAIALLRAGAMPQCWAWFESRWNHSQLKKGRRNLSAPLYQGDAPLQGKSILLYAEQGLGDTIQMLRYIPLLALRGAVIHLEVQPALRKFLTGTPFVHSLSVRGEPLPETDFQCPLMSLPHAFKSVEQTIPRDVPYIGFDQGLAATIGAELAQHQAQHQALKVGVCWKGNPAHTNDRRRSPGLDAFGPLFQVPGPRFFSLVPGAAAELRTAAGPACADWRRELQATPEGIGETAALIMNLDLVVTCDTFVCHLAGALGKPVWLMLPYVPDWRWMLGRDDTPWYPHTRLFRQETRGDWQSVFSRMAGELVRLSIR